MSLKGQISNKGKNDLDRDFSSSPDIWLEGIKENDPIAIGALQRLMINMAIKSATSVTPRECDVLASYAKTGRIKSVAAELFITQETVKSHLKHARLKLNAKNSTHAVAIAIRSDLI